MSAKAKTATPHEELDELDIENENEHDDDVADNDALANGQAKKKKKKKKPKKKASTPKQSDPPRVGLSKLFPSEYPVGEIVEYKDDNAYRTTNEEKRAIERALQEDPSETYQNIRKAAEVHRQVRQYARTHIKPGMSMTAIVELIEDAVRALVEENGLDAGIAFPTGLSRNSCAAHYSPNAGDSNILKETDVLKVDIGVHVKGRICDSAFTLNFQPTYDELLKSVQDATNTGIRMLVSVK